MQTTPPVVMTSRCCVHTRTHRTQLHGVPVVFRSQNRGKWMILVDQWYAQLNTRTRLVWDTTTHVGCGYSGCSHAEAAVGVCRFYPGAGSMGMTDEATIAWHTHRERVGSGDKC